MRIIVTGNIGSGKSTVSRMLAQRLPGYCLVSVDDIVRGLYQDPDFCSALLQEFGVCDRRSVSNLVFGDVSKRLQLEQLSLAYTRPRVNEAMALPKVIVEFPLLLEIPGWAHRADFLLAVGCDEATQRQRVIERDGISPEKFARIQSSQHSTSLKACLADAYLDTSRSLEQTMQDLDALLPAIEAAALRTRCLRTFGSQAVWEALEKAYGEPHRAYHNLAHLQELFAGLDAFPRDMPHRQAVELAIWFHDFVYSTDLAQYPQNEALSAKAMFDILKAHAPDWLEDARAAEVFLAGELILATKAHKVEAPFVRVDPTRLRAAELFLDLDLSILASAPDRLAQYDQQIALEWGQEPTKASLAFCEGRAQALRRLADRIPLFYSQDFAPREEQARRNLSMLSAHWEAQAALLH